jgi:glycosyltransferase involved in cell wall biosynthesis
MRILYDGQIYAMQAAGGINRYFANIISRLPESFLPYLTIPQIPKVNYPQHSNLKSFSYQQLQFRPGRISAWINRYYSSWLNKYYFGESPDHSYFDILHPTYYSLLTQKQINEYSCPVVLTVYDMIHERFSRDLDPTGRAVAEKEKAISSAQAIICISENTKQDLIEWYSVPESKITVTYLASEIDASFSYGLEAVPTRPYFLYVGSRTSYKNFDRLLKALSKVTSVHSDVALSVVGSPFTQDELKQINELGLSKSIEHYGYASDCYLAKLYRCSIAFVYPSLYEGFGIPPLEAMSCGTVVVASNTSSIPEVVGDAGILFDPTSVNNLADILLNLLKNPTDRELLITKGLDRARMFCWDQTIAQTLNVYRSVI